MSLTNKYLLDFDYNEIHSITVKSNLENCYHSTMHLDLSKSKIINFLFRLRGLPFSKTKLSELTKNLKFTLLEESKYTEFIYGFWAKSKVDWINDQKEFINGGKDYQVKSIWSFQFIQKNENECEIITETRVKCLTMKSKILFSIYWFFVKPFSGLVRIEMLKLIKRNLSNHYA